MRRPNPTGFGLTPKSNLFEKSEKILNTAINQSLLKGSHVSGDIRVQGGVLRIQNSEVKGTVTFKGQKAIIKSAKIARLVLEIAEWRDPQVFTRKLIMDRCVIGELVVIRGQNPVSIVTKRADVAITIEE